MRYGKKFVNLAIIFMGLIFMVLILQVKSKSFTSHSQVEHEEENTSEFQRGPHHGRLLEQDSFQLEITIYESGVPPQFRIYPFKKDKALDADEVKLTIELHRLGGRVDVISFKKEQDYLAGDKVVEEPHSFDVKVIAEHGGKVYRWEFPSYEGRTELSPEAVESAGIIIEEAGPVLMESVLELPGEVVLNKDKVVHIVPRFSGIAAKITKNLGDTVQKGETIAIIESRELADAKREYIKALHHLEFSKASFKREKKLWKKKISAEEDYLKKQHTFEESRISYESARQKLKVLGFSNQGIQALISKHDDDLTRYELKAPLYGIVIEKNVAIGQAVKSDDEIFVLADLTTVWVDVTVYAKDSKLIKVGQEVTIKSDVLDEQVSGHISYVGSLVGRKTRAAKAHVVMDNSQGLWRPGLFVTVYLIKEKTNVSVAVRPDAIQSFRDWDVVFIQAGNVFEIRPLELGRKNGEWVEILSGLSAGEKYVSKNAFVLKADILKSGAAHDH